MPEFTAWAACSSAGRVRQANQDSAYAGQWLHAVADGMGGHVAGDVASAAAIEALAAYDAAPDPRRLAELLGQGVASANTAIRQRGDLEQRLRTMGTTLTAMLWSGNAYALAHIGDSRAYCLRGGQIRQLTEDHSLRNLVSGSAASKLLAPIMSRFLDGRPDRSPDLGTGTALPGDRYLLCSDGLTAVVPDQEIRTVLASPRDLHWIAERLCDLANECGGPDNITVIVIAVGARTPSASRPQLIGAAAGEAAR